MEEMVEPVDLPARIRASEALRAIGHALVGGDHTPETIDAVAARLEEVAELLEGAAPRLREPSNFTARLMTTTVPDGAVG
jgi:hypothetical protein